jgi:transposase, IS5 family
MPGGATRLVSLHDPDTRPIRKGRIDKPVEFGYKAQVIDNDDGIILITAPRPATRQTLPSRASDQPDRPARRPPAPFGHRRPRIRQARDRAGLQALGARTVAIPRRAKPSAARRAVEHARGFRKLVKWRTGCEGQISYLKRGYGWDRAQLDGRNGASILCAHEIFTHNLF